MHGDPILFFDKSHPLLVLCILSKNKKILNVRSFNIIAAISTQIRSNFLRMQVYVSFNYPSVRLILPEETILQAKMY